MDLYRQEKHILAIFVCIFGFIDFQNWDIGVFLNKRAYCATTAKIWGLTWKKHTKNTWNVKFLVFTDRVSPSTLMFEVLRVQPNSISVTWLIRLKFGPKMVKNGPPRLLITRCKKYFSGFSFSIPIHNRSLSHERAYLGHFCLYILVYWLSKLRYGRFS